MQSSPVCGDTHGYRLVLVNEDVVSNFLVIWNCDYAAEVPKVLDFGSKQG